MTITPSWFASNALKALLIRHATASHQAPEAPLTPEGVAQAAALVPWLTALGARPLYASSYTRAQATIAPFAKASGQEVTVLPGLRERRLSTADLPDWQDHIRRSFDDPSHAAAGGESHADLCRRAAKTLAQIARRGGDLPAFVTHGGMASALFNACDPAFGFDDWQGLRNPDVFAVTLDTGRITEFTRLEETR